jgi:hypothetical protein
MTAPLFAKLWSRLDRYVPDEQVIDMARGVNRYFHPREGAKPSLLRDVVALPGEFVGAIRRELHGSGRDPGEAAPGDPFPQTAEPQSPENPYGFVEPYAPLPRLMGTYAQRHGLGEVEAFTGGQHLFWPMRPPVDDGNY